MEYCSVMQPDGPMIAVYRGWQGPQKRRRLGPEPPLSCRNRPDCSVKMGDCNYPIQTKRATHRQFQFVNSTTPERSKSDDVRKLVRTNARNHYIQLKRQRDTASSFLSPPTSPSSSLRSHLHTGDSVVETNLPESSDGIDVPDILGHPTALSIAEYAIEMQPRTHRLLSQYLTYASRRIYPGSVRMQSNPLRSPEWFRFAVTDPAMLHAMLYSGAIYLALLEGRKESVDSIYHLGQTISIVNQRLRKSTENIQDSTIGAISCLALGEAITGSQKVWHTHMRGLKHIIQMRGNSSSLSTLLQTKLHRTDLAGALDYSAIPHLHFYRSSRPSIWTRLQNLQGTEQVVTCILSVCQVHPILIATMVDLAYFSRAIISGRTDSRVVVDPTALAEDMYWIQYRLLSFPAASLGGTEEREIDKACRLGALLYIKALLEEFPHSTTGSSILLNRLQESLRNIQIFESTAPLLLWLSLVGAALSKAEMRLWFVGQLVQLKIGFRIPSFHDQELAMSKAISLEQVLGSAVGKLWTEVSEAIRQQSCG